MNTDDPKKLREEYDKLRGHLARFSVMQQQLIGTRDRLDRELARFAAIHEYNTLAIAARSLEAFAETTAEAVVDLFELEFGLVWLLGEQDVPAPNPVSAVGIDTGAWPREQLEAWIQVLRRESAGIVLLDENGPGMETLALSQLVISSCSGKGRALGLVLGGVTRKRASVYDGVTDAHLESFTVFAQQAGALLQNRCDQALIQEQLERLTLSEERLALAVEGGGIGLWDWDLRRNDIYFSPRWQTMLGFEPDELPHDFETWQQRVHPEDLDRSLKEIQAHMGDPAVTYANTHRMQRKDGSYAWILARGKALRDADGVPARMVGMHMDVSDRKEAEETLRRAREQADAANRAKSDFLANMSHEIRTPMNGVLGMLQLLQDAPLNLEQREQIDTAHQSAMYLLAIVDDILDLSKVEAGKLELEAVPFDPARTISNAVDLLAERARAKGLELGLVLGEDKPPLVRGDPGRLRQILTNLIGNAVKFTEQGSVNVTATWGGSGEDVRTLDVAVRDTGIGISREVQQRLFSPFTQADVSTTRRFGGTGLGLAICKRLVELMGGSISVRSEPGQGAEFRFSIPWQVVREKAGTEPSGVPLVENPIQPGRRILLVEDSLPNQKVAEAMLKRAGLNVFIAGNGRLALDLLESEEVDLVLMDLRMPVMDGLEATRRLRRRERELGLDPIPVMALTANAMSEDRQVCLEAGMDDFISKPIDRKTLMDLLGRWLSAA